MGHVLRYAAESGAVCAGGGERALADWGAGAGGEGRDGAVVGGAWGEEGTEGWLEEVGGADSGEEVRF